jgi:hypothetical protein
MRSALSSIVLTMFCGVLSAQQTPAKKSTPPKFETPAWAAGYRVTKDDDSTLLVRRFQKRDKFYALTDRSGKITQLFESTVKNIEPLSGETWKSLTDPPKPVKPPSDLEAKDDVKEEQGLLPESRSDPVVAKSPAKTSYRSTARTSARTTARTSPRPPALDDPPPYVDRTSPGTTATGIPLHVGPRGGIYHFSASGNKVYQRKK